MGLFVLLRLSSRWPALSNILINKIAELQAMKRIFLLLALLAVFAHAIECEGSVQMGLPAVTEGEEVHGGELVVVEIRLVPGEGDAYVAVSPPTDSSLQESIERAVAVAEELFGEKNKCDVLIEVEEDTDYVQGPSGGAAFALMTYALFSGEDIREDATITGAIYEDGTVLPVGGLYEKVLGAKNAGKDYILTPMQTVDEQLMLGKIEGIVVYEVRDIEEAADFFFRDIEPEEKPLNLTVEPLPDIEAYGGEEMPRFREIAENIIEREEDAVSGLEDSALREYFGEKILQQKELIEKGYYYSAANEAFLSYILADSLSRIDEPDVDGKKEEVEECLNSVEEAIPTYDNYEWVMGAEARLKRAENQLEAYGEMDTGTREERYFVVYQLDYAVAWCEAAKDMYLEAAEIGGDELDDEFFKESADMFINISSNYSEIEYSENYVNGMEMYGEGAYAGATYELMYALAFEKKNADMVEGITVEDIDELNLGERNSLWGSVFKAHSYYLLEIEDVEGAYTVAIFSKAMEELWGDVGQKRYQEAFEFPEEGAETLNESGINESEGGECVCPECPEPLCAVAYLLVALPLFVVMRVRDSNSWVPKNLL